MKNLLAIGLVAVLIISAVGSVSATMTSDVMKSSGTTSYISKFNVHFYDVEKNEIQYIHDWRGSSKWLSYPVRCDAAYVSYNFYACCGWEVNRDMVPINITQFTDYGGRSAAIFFDNGGCLGSSDWAKVIINGDIWDSV